MSFKTFKWAFPAFALTAALSTPVEARLPGHTSFGVSAGYSNLTLNGRGHLVSDATNYLGDKEHTSNYSGAEASIFLSRDGDFCRHLNFAVEGYVTGHKSATGTMVHRISDDDDTSAFTRVKQDYSVGLRFKLGHYIKKDVLLYVALGAKATSFNVAHNVHSNAVAFAGVYNYDKDHVLYAWTPGVGLKWKISRAWSCHVDATYSLYGGLTKRVDSSLTNDYIYTLGMTPEVFGLTIGFSRPL